MGSDRKGRVLAIKQCDFCGKDVEIRHKKRLVHKHFFCSHKCESQYRIANNPNYIRCANCGKLTYKKPKEQKMSKTNLLCCSRKCASEIQKTLFLGEGNPNYGNSGIDSPLHKSDTCISCYGYRYIALAEPHPFAVKGFWIFEHRYLAEKYLMTDEQSVEIDGKRYLNPIYDVHHKDQNRLNNDLSNLQIVTRSEHQKIHYRLRKEKEAALLDETDRGAGGFGSTGK